MAVKKSIVKGVNAIAALQAVADAASVAPVALPDTNEVVKKQAVAVTKITHADGTVESAAEAVGSPKFFTSHPWVITTGAGLKVQLEQYKLYAECTLSLSAPCTLPELDEVADWAQNWVDGRMAVLHGKLNGAIVVPK